ncbi:MAG TPA: hypothetical protein VK978_02635 [Candidatus Saccharimonadales bacterium]|nr:hypothetical protein [Candidatus Saccharimonadales bacterium]
MSEQFNCTSNPCARCPLRKVQVGRSLLLAAVDTVNEERLRPPASRLPAKAMIKATIREYDIPLPDAGQLIVNTMRIIEEGNCTPRPTISQD